MEAAGNQTAQGKEYLNRLAKEDSAIDALSAEITEAQESLKKAEKEYEIYLSALTIE